MSFGWMTTATFPCKRNLIVSQSHPIRMHESSLTNSVWLLLVPTIFLPYLIGIEDFDFDGISCDPSEAFETEDDVREPYVF